MRIITGLVLIFIAIIGTTYFSHYKGELIGSPTLWYFLFFGMGLIGALLMYSATRKIKTIVDNQINVEIEKIKSNADKIELNFDQCEFKSGSFSHKVRDPNMAAIEIFADTPLSEMDNTITENVVRSYFTYTTTIKGQTIILVSQSFPFDDTTLKYHVLNNDISLYVDRFNPKKYYFDLQR